MTGFVYLVGAGPGDAELLTLKSVKALRKADVILCDDLVGEDVLEYARPNARVVRVGKRGGQPSTSQAFIERLMVSEARHGAIVVRLKGGDPFMFGRGGEECDALRAAGVPFEVVPGITSGMAAATALGVPLTERGVSRGVIFVTGHEAADRPNDWKSLAQAGLTLVIYMGVARCARIQAELLEAGMAAGTPVAVVSHATRLDQASVVTRLDRLAKDLDASGIGSPAIIIIGDVVTAQCTSATTRASAETMSRRSAGIGPTDPNCRPRIATKSS